MIVSPIDPWIDGQGMCGTDFYERTLIEISIEIHAAQYGAERMRGHYATTYFHFFFPGRFYSD